MIYNRSISTKAAHLTLLCIALLSLLSTSWRIQAQGSQSIYTGALIQDMSWSTNSQLLVFDNTDDSVWYQYDTNTGALGQNTTWPLQPNLSAADTQILNQAAYGTDQSAVFLSPSSHYVAYAGPRASGTDAGWSMMIANLQSQQTAKTNAEILYPYSAPADFNILWSNSETAFLLTITTLSRTPVSYYVNGYTNDITAAQAQLLVNMNIAGATYNANAAFDVSNDGNKAILSISSSTLPVIQSLVLWNALSPNTSQLLQGIDASKVLGAAFAPGDETKILIANDQGLLQYDLVTNTISSLQGNIGSTPAMKAIFSPDGKFLAEVVATSNGQNSIYILSTTFSIEGLRAQVAVCVSDHDLGNSLNAKIDQQNWNAFINEVEAQSGKKIDKTCADQIIATATFFLTNPPPIPTSTK